MRVRDVMTTDVETVGPDDEVGDVLVRLARASFSGFPVIDDDERVVGVVTERDLVGLFQAPDRTLWIPVGFPPFLESVTYGIDLPWDELDLGVDLVRNAGRPIRKVMSSPAVTVRPDDDLDRAVELLSSDNPDINRLPVVEGGGLLVGIVSRQDVLRALRDRKQ